MKRFCIFEFGISVWSSQNRKTLSVALWAIFIALCHHAEAQPRRIGVLLALPRSAISDRLDAFEEGLRKLGYAERKNIVLEYRHADGQFEIIFYRPILKFLRT